MKCILQWILLYLLPGGCRWTACGWVLSYSILWALCRELTRLISWCCVNGYHDVLDGFIHPLVETSYPGPCTNVSAPVPDVSNQDAFYLSSVKMWLRNLAFLTLLKEFSFLYQGCDVWRQWFSLCDVDSQEPKSVRLLLWCRKWCVSFPPFSPKSLISSLVLPT